MCSFEDFKAVLREAVRKFRDPASVFTRQHTRRLDALKFVGLSWRSRSEMSEMSGHTHT